MTLPIASAVTVVAPAPPALPAAPAIQAAPRLPVPAAATTAAVNVTGTAVSTPPVRTKAVVGDGKTTRAVSATTPVTISGGMVALFVTNNLNISFSPTPVNGAFGRKNIEVVRTSDPLQIKEVK